MVASTASPLIATSILDLKRKQEGEEDGSVWRSNNIGKLIGRLLEHGLWQVSSTVDCDPFLGLNPDAEDQCCSELNSELEQGTPGFKSLFGHETHHKPTTHLQLSIPSRVVGENTNGITACTLPCSPQRNGGTYL